MHTDQAAPGAARRAAGKQRQRRSLRIHHVFTHSGFAQFDTSRRRGGRGRRGGRARRVRYTLVEASISGHVCRRSLASASPIIICDPSRRLSRTGDPRLRYEGVGYAIAHAKSACGVDYGSEAAGALRACGWKSVDGEPVRQNAARRRSCPLCGTNQLSSSSLPQPTPSGALSKVCSGSGTRATDRTSDAAR